MGNSYAKKIIKKVLDSYVIQYFLYKNFPKDLDR